MIQMKGLVWHLAREVAASFHLNLHFPWVGFGSSFGQTQREEDVKSLLLIPVLILSGTLVASGEELPTTKEVLDKFVAAVGGADALHARTEVMYEGTIVTELNWKDPSHTETPFRARAGKDCSLLVVESASWDDLPLVDTGTPREKLRWLMHPYFPDLLVTGQEIRDDRPVVVLSPAGKDKENYAFYFDEETGLLNHIGFHNDLVGWREINGVLFPREFVFGRKGGHTTYRFDVVHVVTDGGREKAF